MKKSINIKNLTSLDNYFILSMLIFSATGVHLEITWSRSLWFNLIFGKITTIEGIECYIENNRLYFSGSFDDAAGDNIVELVELDIERYIGSQVSYVENMMEDQS